MMMKMMIVYVLKVSHRYCPLHCLQPFEISDDYCGEYDINHPIKGTEPVSREAVVVWNNVTATAIAVTNTGDFTVAFIGTDNGYLHKVGSFCCYCGAMLSMGDKIET